MKSAFSSVHQYRNLRHLPWCAGREEQLEDFLQELVTKLPDQPCDSYSSLALEGAHEVGTSRQRVSLKSSPRHDDRKSHEAATRTPLMPCDETVAYVYQSIT
jgi:hypothetical protein